MKELSVKELKAKLDGGENIQLIDVREQHEVEICSFDNALLQGPNHPKVWHIHLKQSEKKKYNPHACW